MAHTFFRIFRQNLASGAVLALVSVTATAQIAPPSASPVSTDSAPNAERASRMDFRPGWKVYVVRLIRHHPNMLPGTQGYKLGAPELSYIHPADKPDIYGRAFQTPLPGAAYGVVLKGFLNLSETGRYHLVTTLPKGPDVACQKTILLDDETVLATKHGHQLIDQAMIEQVSAELAAGQVPIEIRLACAYERTGHPTSPALGSKIQFRIQLKAPSGDVLEPLRADQVVHSATTRYE